MAFRLFRRAARPEEAKASAAAPVMALHGIGRAAWSPRDQVSLARNGYQNNVIGFRAVRMVAEAAAAVPLTVLDGGARAVDHPLARLLARPNPGADGRTFLEAVYGHLQLSGNAYVEGAGHDNRGWPRELHALRPDRMRVVPGPDGWPMAYEYTVGSREASLVDGGGCQADPASQGLPSARRSLRDEPARGRGRGRGHP